MRKKSTSLHQLNADYRMGRAQKALYMPLNRVNNSFPFLWADKQVVYRDFKCEDLKAQWGKIPLQSTPARKLCDLFCIELPWREIRAELGEIHVLDCGCGSGRYGERLLEYGPCPPTAYTGIDVAESDKWPALEKKYPNFAFHRVHGNDISGLIPAKTNLILSMTALEHFEEDIFYFEQIRDFIDSRKKPVLQIHCFPSPACLKLYRFHGIRQYTPRTVGKFTRLFHPSSDMVLYSLGGKNCNRVHYRYITRPMTGKKSVDLRKADIEAYDKKLFAAVQSDMAEPCREPTFYALTIRSYFQDKLVSLQPSSDGKPTTRRVMKSFSGGPGGRFFKKAPLAAGGNNKINATRL